jgi:hypothetical protein
MPVEMSPLSVYHLLIAMAYVEIGSQLGIGRWPARQIISKLKVIDGLMYASTGTGLSEEDIQK